MPRRDVLSQTSVPGQTLVADNRKRRGFVLLVNEEMDPVHTQITYERFMEDLVPGMDIPSDKLAEVGNLEALKMRYKDNHEKAIYPVLVSAIFLTLSEGKDLRCGCSAPLSRRLRKL